MKKIIYIISLLLIPLDLLGHTLVLNILDNEDNTILVEGMFNTGESASGAIVKIETLSSKKVLWKKRLSDEEEMIIEIPKVPYKIILDGGKGHIVERIGIPPLSGFDKEDIKVIKKEIDEKTYCNEVIIFSLLMASLLLFLTIFIGIKNTNKILYEIQNEKA